MRCENCNYPLWNLRSRQCPECGTAFRPSQYEFARNSVRFLCPHCGQDYYGTGERGHLVPTEFSCVRCAAAVSMDEMVLLPTEGVTEEQTATDVMPWLHRVRIGRVKAWFKTIGMGLFQPARLIRATPEGSSGGAALWFAAVTSVLYGLPIAAILVLLLGGAFVTAPGGGGGGGAVWAMSFGLGVILLLAVLAGIMTALVWGLIAHAILRITGPTAGGIGRTYHAVGYSSGANVAMAIPCIGFYLIPLSWLWWAISAGTMLAIGQRVAWWRAAIAAAIMPVVMIGLVVGLFVLPIYYGVQSTASRVQALVVAPTQSVLDGVLLHARTSGGSGPAHAIELVDGGAVLISEFITPGSATNLNQVPAGAVTLDQIPSIPPDQRAAHARIAAEALPPDVIAHRLGDMVLTYHGIDLGAADPGLWLVISSPDPDQNAKQTTSWLQPVVGVADGTVAPIPSPQWATALAAQNQLRARYGLAPLPDPRTITHDAPAVAGGVTSPPQSPAPALGGGGG